MLWSWNNLRKHTNVNFTVTTNIDELDGGVGILYAADYLASLAGVTVDLLAGAGLGGDAEGIRL